MEGVTSSAGNFNDGERSVHLFSIRDGKWSTHYTTCIIIRAETQEEKVANHLKAWADGR
jgi:hypothetical protein